MRPIEELGALRVTAHSDAKRFWALAGPLLTQAEAVNCLALGVLHTLANDPDRSASRHLLAIEGEAGLQGIAWWTPPHPLGLSAMPSAAVDALVEYLASTLDAAIPAVAGPEPAVDQFKDRWLRQHGGSVRKTIEQRIHRLDQVTRAERAPGSLRTATLADRALVSEWSLGFVADCGLDDGEEWVERAVASALSQGCRVLWEFEGAPVSMAGFQGQTPSGIRVSWVYTPPAVRGRGYASALVAALSERLLAEGRKHCFLYTDLANATSNRIYEQIGYRPVCAAAYHSFGE